MRILLTNDDGINSESLLALSERLSREHEVWIVAPDRERSGSSHSITLDRSIRVNELEERTFACEGTPVDCVILACLGLVPTPIDFVLSGPNRGPNLGTDIIYSGTVAAARQATLMGCPSLASSLLSSDGELPAAEFLARNLGIFNELASTDHFININFPAELSRRMTTAVTFPSVRIYYDSLDTTPNDDGSLNYRITGPPPVSHDARGSDYDAVSRGEVSISPITIHPSNHVVEDTYQNQPYWNGGES